MFIHEKSNMYVRKYECTEFVREREGENYRKMLSVVTNTLNN